MTAHHDGHRRGGTKSERRSVRAMSLSRVRGFVLMLPATVSRVGNTLTLSFESCASGADRMDQQELTRLFSAEQLAVEGARIALCIRDLSAESQQIRSAA